MDRTTLSMAIAIFSMFFGAGNVVFPLFVGVESESNYLYAFLGLFLTAIGGPLLGLLGATLCRGCCREFFFLAGKIPGIFLLMVCFALLGPFAVLPRCITVAYAASTELLGGIPLYLFAIAFSAISLACCWKHRYLLPALGYILSPLLILSLLFIIFEAIIFEKPLSPSMLTSTEAFSLGFWSGYGTMDLIASIFFSTGIWTMVHLQIGDNPRSAFALTLKSGILGCLLLSLIYMGLTYSAAKYSEFLIGIPQAQLLIHLAAIVLGPSLGMVANLAVALACLTTVISLTMTLSEIATQELGKEIISYKFSVIVTLAITALMANVGFSGIMLFLKPLLTICYPLIIALTLVNITTRLLPSLSMGDNDRLVARRMRGENLLP